MDSRRRRRIVKLVGFVLPAFLIFLAGMIWAVQSLWNWLMPSIFRLGTITYWQALGLMVLCWILFRGSRGPSMGGRWRHDMKERWERMTPEEREKFMSGVRSRWAGKEAPGPQPEPKA